MLKCNIFLLADPWLKFYYSSIDMRPSGIMKMANMLKISRADILAPKTNPVATLKQNTILKLEYID